MRREPGEIEIWDTPSKEWVKNKRVCFVSESSLCAKPGCNRKPKHATGPPSNPDVGRFCSHQCSIDVRVGINKIED